jgi:hypothetical protein
MTTSNESITSDTTRAQSSTSTAKATAPATDDHAPAKPPLLWMLVPLLLIGLAIYFAR